MLGATRTRIIAVSSIGSGSVSVGIAACDGRSAKLLVSERRTLPLEKRVSQHAAGALKQQLTEAMHAMFSRYNTDPQAVHPDSLHCIIRAPWSHSEMIHVETTFQKEELITKAMITDLARRALPTPINRGNFLEASVVQIELNGYPAVNPEGKRAHNVAITALISSCQGTMLKFALETFALVLPAQPHVVHSGTRAILEALAVARPTISDCLVLDVAEEGTTAILIRHGSPDIEMYLAEGIRSILARVQGAPEDTRVALRMIARDECSQGACVTIQEGFAKIEPDLVQAFGEFFAKMSSSLRIPNTMVLIAQPDVAPWLSRFFSRIDFTQFTLTAQPFEIIPLWQQNAPSVAQSASDIDIDLSLALALINKESQ